MQLFCIYFSLLKRGIRNYSGLHSRVYTFLFSSVILFYIEYLIACHLDEEKYCNCR